MCSWFFPIITEEIFHTCGFSAERTLIFVCWYPTMVLVMKFLPWCFRYRWQAMVAAASSLCQGRVWPASSLLMFQIPLAGYGGRSVITLSGACLTNLFSPDVSDTSGRLWWPQCHRTVRGVSDQQRSAMAGAGRSVCWAQHHARDCADQLWRQGCLYQGCCFLRSDLVDFLHILLCAWPQPCSPTPTSLIHVCLFFNFSVHWYIIFVNFSVLLSVTLQCVSVPYCEYSAGSECVSFLTVATWQYIEFVER